MFVLNTFICAVVTAYLSHNKAVPNTQPTVLPYIKKYGVGRYGE